MTLYVGGQNNTVHTVRRKSDYSITMGGSDGDYYPIAVSRSMGTKIHINKHVHSGGTWDGYLQFQLETNSYGWGGWNNTVVLKQYERSTREFVHSHPSTATAGSYILIYLLGGNSRVYNISITSMVGTPVLLNSGLPYYTATAIGNNGTTEVRTSSTSGQIAAQSLVA